MPRPGRPPTYDHDDVLDRAMHLFWHRGYGAASMRDLGDAVGLLPGSLYGAFGDKHALFLLALERYAEDVHDEAEELTEGRRVLPRVRALLMSVLEDASDEPGRGCMLGNTAVELLPADDKAAEVVEGALDSLEGAIEQSLERGQKSGEIRSDIDAGACARMLLALMQGLHVVARLEDEPERLADAIDAALEPLAD